jgi:hypothetical protein
MRFQTRCLCGATKEVLLSAVPQRWGKRASADYDALTSRLVVDDQRSRFAMMHADNMTPKIEKKKRIREARELIVTIEFLS